eukprot:364001-Chlamydomonas_euryale.AAC.17
MPYKQTVTHGRNSFPTTCFPALSASDTSAAVPGPMPIATMTAPDSALILLRPWSMPVKMGMSTASDMPVESVPGSTPTVSPPPAWKHRTVHVAWVRVEGQ